MNVQDYKYFLLKSIFYDLSLYFGSESKIGKNLSDLEKILEYNNLLLDKVSSKLVDIISDNNGFKFTEPENKKFLKSIFTTFKKHVEKDKTTSGEYTINGEYIRYYPLSEIKNSIIYPDKIKDNSSDDYEKYIENLDWEKIVDSEDINSVLNTLSNIFCYVPYFKDGKYGIGDISFYDKLKINTALASCLYLLKERNELNESFLNDDEYEHFVLLSGDISGIQKFIYTISSISKGVLKSLRARSFYLEIMLEHIADEILEYFNLTRANLLYTGGGHFYLILPNYSNIEEIINNIIQRLNDWFIDNFYIDLYIAMGVEKFNFNNLKDFSSVFKKLSSKLTQMKQRRYIYGFDNSQLNNLLSLKVNKYRECTICHSGFHITRERIIKNEKTKESNLGYVCDTCFNLYNAGKYMLSKEESIFVVNNNGKESLDNNLMVGLPSLYYECGKNENKEIDRYLYFGTKEKINSSNLVRAYSKNNKENKYVNLFLGDYNFKEDKEDKNLIDFETLVKGTENNNTIGINRLAVLRCDVDSLGDAFMNGFIGHADILRTSSFSRHLSLFFKYYINFICEGNINIDNYKLFGDSFHNNSFDRKEEKRIVIVYSGGDDVFLVGHWLDVINFSFDLRESFRKYTDDKLTFSAGIGFFHTKYPISKMASQTGELEDLAKKNEYTEKNKCIKKDSVALFGIPHSYKTEEDKSFKYVFTWDEFKEIKSKIDFLFSVCYFSKDDYDKEKVLLSVSLMYRLKQLIELYDKDRGINIARLAYSLARINYNNENNKNYNLFKDKIYNWFTAGYKEKEDKKNENDKKSKYLNKEIKYLNIALDFIIYLFRKE